MSNNTKQSEAFTIWSDEVGTRLDPFFYRPVFKKLVASINDTKHKTLSLDDIVEFSIAGDWGEDPDTFEPTPDYRLCYVLRNTNFDNKYNLNFDDVAQRYIKNSKVEKLVLQKGDILIEKSGGSPVQPVGRVAFVEELPFDKPVVFSNFLQKIRIADSSFLPEYIFTFLQAVYHLGYTEFLQNQTTGIKNLRLDDFFAIKIAKLPKEEQKKISRLAFDARCQAKKMEEEARQVLVSTNNFMLYELGVEITTGGVKQIFQVWSDEIITRLDPLYLRDYSAYSNVKSKYPLTMLKELLSQPPQYGANERAISGNPLRDVRYIRITDVAENGELKSGDWKTAEHIEDRYALQQDDLLFARSGATAGKTYIYKNTDGKAIFAGYMIRFKIDPMKAIPDYVFYLTKTRYYELWKNLIQRPSGQPNINSEEFRAFKLPLPPVLVQKKIVEKVKSLYIKTRTLRAQAVETLANSQKQVEQMILA